MDPTGHHHTKPLKEGKFSPGMWHPQQGDSEVQTYRDEQTSPGICQGMTGTRVRTRVLALAEQHNLAPVCSRVCRQVRKEDFSFLEVGISCI